MFYGLIFSESSFSQSLPATFVPWGEGYAPFLQGRVVDMLYFPMFTIHFPKFLPFVGGTSFLFFRPVFNIADAAVSVSAFLFIVFRRKWPEYMKQEEKEKKKKEEKKKKREERRQMRAEMRKRKAEEAANLKK